MDDTVKVIIELPKKVFEARKIGEISPWVTVPILDAVQNGIPLDDVLDKTKGYVEHIRNTSMGKKKSLNFIEKYIEGLKTESEE